MRKILQPLLIILSVSLHYYTYKQEKTICESRKFAYINAVDSQIYINLSLSTILILPYNCPSNHQTLCLPNSICSSFCHFQAHASGLTNKYPRMQRKDLMAFIPIFTPPPPIDEKKSPSTLQLSVSCVMRYLSNMHWIKLAKIKYQDSCSQIS